MKVGDKVYCKKKRKSKWKSKYNSRVIYKDEECTVVQIDRIQERIQIRCHNGEFSFHIGEYDTDYYNFSDYFYSIVEYRKLKLEKINGRK